MRNNKYFFLVVLTLILIGCFNSSTNIKANENQNRLSVSFEKFLNKKEIKAFVDIVAQKTIQEQEKDSLVNLIFERTHNPLKFDEIYKNPIKSTISEWEAYYGDKKTWELTNLELYLYEFGLIGNIDGFGGVVSTLESSKHGKSIDLQSINYSRYDFEVPMNKIDTELKKSERMILTVDLSVFIIRIKDYDVFKSLIEKTTWGKVVTYSKS